MYKKVITMTAWRRPEYTKQVIDNLKKCIGFEEYILLPTIEPEYPEVLKTFNGLSNCKMVVNNKRLGCPSNTFKALKRGFDISDFVIHLEDDTVPGIDSLKYFEWTYRTYKDDKEVFTACAYNKMKNINPENYFTVYKLRWFTPWLWCTWIDRFEEMKKNWDFNSFGPNINHKVRKNRYEIRPCIARSQNIGEHAGTYNNSGLWRKDQYNPIWINNISNTSFENLTYKCISDDFRVDEHGKIYKFNKDNIKNLIEEDNIKNYVIEGYRNILKRNPDPGGFKHYTTEIFSGRITKERFLEILRTSEEYNNKFKK